MNLKTYRARSMSDALAEVKRDLGPDAVILHTRSLRVGGVLGVGTRGLVEVTAALEAPPTDEAAAPAGDGPRRGTAAPEFRSNGTDHFSPSRTPAAPRPAGVRMSAPIPQVPRYTPTHEQSQRLPVVHTCRTAAAEFRAYQPRPADTRPATVTQSGRPAPRGEARPGSSAQSRQTQAPATSREDELASIRRMLAQVLRRTAAAPANRKGATGDPPGPLSDCYLRLLESEVAPEIAEELMGRVRAGLTPKKQADPDAVTAAVRRELAALIPVSDDPPAPERAHDGRPATVALVGPTGVGKTTTAAKLAATSKLRHSRKVGLITTDTYRIAAVEQLRVYADIIGVPLKVAMTPDDMRAACASLADRDVIFIDTAGRSPRDGSRLVELGDLLAAASPHRTHLVLSATAGERALQEAASHFTAARPDRLILTKLDEAANFGGLISSLQRVSLPLSHLTTGQEVPDHLEPPSPERLAALVMDGWR